MGKDVRGAGRRPGRAWASGGASVASGTSKSQQSAAKTRWLSMRGVRPPPARPLTSSGVISSPARPWPREGLRLPSSWSEPLATPSCTHLKQGLISNTICYIYFLQSYWLYIKWEIQVYRA